MPLDCLNIFDSENQYEPLIFPIENSPIILSHIESENIIRERLDDNSNQIMDAIVITPDINLIGSTLQSIKLNNSFHISR